MDIDWSKAPDWADGHALIAHHGITEVWVSMDQYAVVGRDGGPYPYGGGTGDARHNHTRGALQYITPRPARWDGEGLPPVDFSAEAFFHADTNPDWLPFKLKYFSDEHVVFLGPIGECHMSRCAFDKYGFKFRPIRTPEQIAAEDREKAIKEMIGFIGGSRRREAEYLYDAGYRKQVTP